MSRPADTFVERGLLERYLLGVTPRLRGYAYVLTGSREDAEDVLQEVFLKFLARRPWPDHAAADRWLFRVCRNEALSALRSRRRRARREGVYAETAAAEPANPSDAVGERESLEKIGVCLGRLEPGLREMLYLKVVEGLSLREIEERTGVPKSTVACRVAEALVLLNRSFHGGG